MMNTFYIPPISSALDQVIQEKINLKTKPVSSLGKLEEVGATICRIQQSLTPVLKAPHILVFAADHGIAAQGAVNPFPQEVTYQMVYNFLSGGAAINVFGRQHDISIRVVDAGVNHDFEEVPGLINTKIDYGTKDYRFEKAMSTPQCLQALTEGATLIEDIISTGCNVIGFGEMGIGNTSSASLLMSTLCDIPIEECTGKGTGAVGAVLQKKIYALKEAQSFHGNINREDTLEVLSTFGGFEIAQMCGAMLAAAEKGMLLLIDGFISTAALLVAYSINPSTLSYCIFSHCSEEQGHKMLLKYLNATPLLNLQMCLGEGSGIAVAYPLLQSACAFINEMASFQEAKVSNQE
ncbi:nicotinate-nucleotide--dimethylbenzimidazole phosphoribosyltransferase [Algivirga pacifica]|uniref:Nicotinate-nucleotide--dimethylbenzimidazole phosphoribosyltransferase n=1 Tax=Algivirga pacifica TaxID=1162670 RepID=A0ABP9DHL0_9BACT